MKLTKEDDLKICDLYFNQKLSSVEIGEIMHVSHRTILNHLNKLNVPKRTRQESQFAKNKKEIPKEFENYDVMYDLYVKQHKTKEQLGVMFNCAPYVIDKVLKKLSIHVRGVSEAKIGVQVGNEHHNWKGGIAPLLLRCRQFYQANIAPIIRERDNYTCQLCGAHSNLHTHHIIPLKKIISDILSEHRDLDPIKNVNELYEIIVTDRRFIDLNNMITYCKECHLFKVHGYSKTIRSEAS